MMLMNASSVAIQMRYCAAPTSDHVKVGWRVVTSPSLGASKIGGHTTGVGVAVLVGVGDGPGVMVGVGVYVGVTVGVSVAVGVAVRVGRGVKVGRVVFSTR